jgi:membrane dipeptidase
LRGAAAKAERHPVKDASSFPNLIDALNAHGFDDTTIGKIGFDNRMRVFRLTLR